MKFAWIAAMALPMHLSWAQMEDAASNRWSQVESIVTTLSENRFGVVDGAGEMSRLMEAIHALDPGGKILSAAEERQRQDREHGLRLGLGWYLAATNNQVVCSAPASGSAAKAIPAGGGLVSLGDSLLSEVSWSSVIRRLRSLEEGSVQMTFADPMTGAATPLVLSPVVGREPTLAAHELWLNHLLYIRIHGLYPDSDDALLEAALGDVAPSSGVILDLRDAEGENAATVLKIVSYFCPEGRDLGRWMIQNGIVARELKSISGSGKLCRAPLVLLINHNTSRAAEVLAIGLSRHYPHTLLVGEPTAGDPMLRESLSANGRFLYIATKSFQIGEKTVEAGQPLKPDISVEDRDVPDVPWSDSKSLAPGKNYLRAGMTNEQLAQLRLMNRIRYDAILRQATDILLGLRALSESNGP